MALCGLEELKDVDGWDVVYVKLGFVAEVVVEDEVRKTRPAARPVTRITTITAMMRTVRRHPKNHRVTARINPAAVFDQLDRILRVESRPHRSEHPPGDRGPRSSIRAPAGDGRLAHGQYEFAALGPVAGIGYDRKGRFLS